MRINLVAGRLLAAVLWAVALVSIAYAWIHLSVWGVGAVSFSMIWASAGVYRDLWRRSGVAYRQVPPARALEEVRRALREGGL